MSQINWKQTISECEEWYEQNLNIDLDKVKQNVIDWNDGSDEACNTNGVNPKRNLKLFHNKTKDIFCSPVKVKIEPKLQPLMCWHNSKFMNEKFGYEIVDGINFTACKCGRLVCGEVHSINKVNGKYIDFTRDFNNEKYKWFLQFKNKDISAEEFNVVSQNVAKTFGLPDLALFNIGSDKCNCPNEWSLDSAIFYDYENFNKEFKKVIGCLESGLITFND